MTDPSIIKQRLAALGITQGQIAKELGCTRQCVNSALNGETVTKVREWVCAKLGQSELELFGPRRKRGWPTGRQRDPMKRTTEQAVSSNKPLLDKVNP